MYEIKGSIRGGEDFETVGTYVTETEAREEAWKNDWVGVWSMTYGEEGYTLVTPEGEEIDL